MTHNRFCKAENKSHWTPVFKICAFCDSILGDEPRTIFETLKAMLMAERAARLAAESEAHHRRGGSTLRSGLDDIRAWHANSKNKGGEARLGDHRCDAGYNIIKRKDK